MDQLTVLLCFSILCLGYGLPNPQAQRHRLDLEHLEQYGSPGHDYRWSVVESPISDGDVRESMRFDPVQTNAYHLFTRDNPVVSQPLLLNNPNLLQTTNYRSNKRTIVLVHGRSESVISDFNSVLIPDKVLLRQPAQQLLMFPLLGLKSPFFERDWAVIYHAGAVFEFLVLGHAGFLKMFSFTVSRAVVMSGVFLAAEDVNIIVVDWSLGASAIDPRILNRNTIASGVAVGAFINWVNQESGSTPVLYHIVGHGVGGHQAGVIGRNVDGDVAYITALDPAFLGWASHPDRFNANDGQYTEVIHTNYGINGFLADLGDVDFYPNGGISMPGCDSHACHHARSYFYFAESITSGGFTGRQCVNYFAAILNTCDVLPGSLQMGGLKPKIGRTGVYLLETNASPPFSQD